MQTHDPAFAVIAHQTLAYAAAGGASASSSAFGTQTRYIQVSAPGVFSATGGIRFDIATTPTASSTTGFLPFNCVRIYKVSPGEKIAALSNDTVTGTLNITELL